MSKTDKQLFKVADWYWLTIPFSIVVLLGLCYINYGSHQKLSNKERAFRRFFLVAPPASVELAAYGFDRTPLGDGSYALIFKIPETELRPLLEQQGFAAVQIERDPTRWRLDFCNATLGRLTKSDIQILPTFECFSKDTNHTSARVFFDRDQSRAVFLGFGRYPLK